MANTHIAYERIVFDVREEGLTHCYVFINNLSNDGLLGVHGWHHKAFPAAMSVKDIMDKWDANEIDPLLWPQAAPEPM